MPETDDDELVLKVEKDPLIGKTLTDRYQIVSVLGRGGMGTVYKAHQTDMDRFVAIKTLHLSRIMDSHTIQKFRSEAQAVSRVRHPNTVTLYDFGVSEQGVPFLVMEMLDGRSFRDILKESSFIKPGRINLIFQQVCSALANAHDSGIVHKDMKPENIMLSNRAGQAEFVHVLDFGIAGLMEGGPQQNEIVGSPPYMSPEQCSAQPNVDQRSDIYSLGVCLFEAACGKFPYQARTAMEMLDCHVSGKPLLLKDMGTRFSTYESLTQVILKAMEKRPDKRQKNVQELAAELEDAVKKDSKRGLALRERATMEIDAPKAGDYVEHKNDEPEETESKKSGVQGLTNSLKNLVQLADEKRESKDKAETEEPEYHFSNCPHCDAPTQPGIKLCLACGRSLASRDDFSKLRASKGDFSLPKTDTHSGTFNAINQREFNQRARLAITKSSQARTRSAIITAVIVAIGLGAFLALGGVQFLSNMLPQTVPQNVPESVPDKADKTEAEK